MIIVYAECKCKPGCESQRVCWSPHVLKRAALAMNSYRANLIRQYTLSWKNGRVKRY